MPIYEFGLDSALAVSVISQIDYSTSRLSGLGQDEDFFPQQLTLCLGFKTPFCHLY